MPKKIPCSHCRFLNDEIPGMDPYCSRYQTFMFPKKVPKDAANSMIMPEVCHMKEISGHPLITRDLT